MTVEDAIKFRIRGFAGTHHKCGLHGALLLETIHTSLSSAQIEIECWKARLKEPGQIDHVELIDCRLGGRATNLRIYADTEIDWEKRL